MKSLTLWQIDCLPWCVFAAYWAITALRVKPTKAQEKLAGRLGTLVVVGVSFELLFSRGLRYGLLGERFVPAENGIAWVGIVLTYLGVAIAVWARYCLGEFWSARVTLKVGHQIIRSGPYAFVRHPIYTGMLTAVAGTALVIGEWRGVLALALILISFWRKALREENMLTAESGEAYAAYRRSTGFLIPRLIG
jgi:protein-S-isoprenylcysteine O-methyltransferase Ste14